MFYKIVEVSTDKTSGHTYVLVHFWRRRGNYQTGKPPDRINDFLMQLRPAGAKLIDPDDPGKGAETYDRDLPAEIRTNIEAYWARAEANNYLADHSDPRIQRDNSDPHGVLARPDVTALRGAEGEKP